MSSAVRQPPHELTCRPRHSSCWTGSAATACSTSTISPERAGQQLDVNDPRQRQQAVAATIDASSGILRPPERLRLAELSIFAEDESIPVVVVADLWNATGEMDGVGTRALCARLEDLSLLTLTPTADGGAIGLHDVIRDVLRRNLGAERLRALNRLLLATAAGQGDGGSRTATRTVRSRIFATRCDKLKDRYHATVTVASIMVWLRAKPDRARP